MGTCELMCPEAERRMREQNGNVRLFERPNPAEMNVSSPALAVKTFARTGVRPWTVLCQVPVHPLFSVGSPLNFTGHLVGSQTLSALIGSA